MNKSKCPRCGSEDIRIQTIKDIEYYGVEDHFNMITIFGCFDCGETFEANIFMKIVEVTIND